MTLPREIVQLVDRAVDRMRMRMEGIVSFGVIKSHNDGPKTQTVEVSIADDDTPPKIPHYQPGGVSHRPTAGAEGLYVAVGAQNGNGVMIAISKRGARVKASMAGGTVIYAEVGSNAPVELKPDGTAGVLIGDDPEQAMVKGNIAADAVDALVVLTAMGPASISPSSAAAFRASLSTKHKLDV